MRVDASLTLVLSGEPEKIGVNIDILIGLVTGTPTGAASPYPPKPYPARVGHKTRAGKPAVPQPSAGRPTHRVYLL